jgi:3-deoxy-D-manno-octulosonate 8-phosphate phosphatase KdsC-like HAD superfamily phosphatase
MNSKELKVQDVYIENGYKNREDYLKNLAANFDIDLENVLMIADMLGPNEDFDGLVTSLEDFTG